MAIELECPGCDRPFTWRCATSAGQVLNRIADGDRALGMGDGQTIEDLVYAAVISERSVQCPHCHAALEMNDDGVAIVAQQLLQAW